jgi:hypothetical protein
MAKNPAGKSRKQDNPYITITLGSWTWKVLKFWQADGQKEYGRAFCAVSSPATYGSADLGDVYVSELRDVLLRGAGWSLEGSPLDAEQAAALLGLKRLP